MNKQIINGLGILLTVMYFSFMVILIMKTNRLDAKDVAVQNSSHAEAVVLTVISLWVFLVLVLCKYHCDRAVQASQIRNASAKLI